MSLLDRCGGQTIDKECVGKELSVRVSQLSILRYSVWVIPLGPVQVQRVSFIEFKRKKKRPWKQTKDRTLIFRHTRLKIVENTRTLEFFSRTVLLDVHITTWDFLRSHPKSLPFLLVLDLHSEERCFDIHLVYEKIEKRNYYEMKGLLSRT